MAKKTRPRRTLPGGLLLALLVGMVVVPALLSLSVGVVALALWREGFDIVLGVLTLSFGASAIAGGMAAVGFMRRNAKLAELQADFVAKVSHELRTPLAGIRLVADTLEAGRGDDPARLGVLTEMLGDEVRHLEDLVQRILSWRHLDQRGSDHTMERLGLQELVDAAIAGVSHLPEARGATFETAIAHGLPDLVGNRRSLLEALKNLVHNAVKFGATRGPIVIDAAYDGPEVILRVTDHGPGIPQAEQRQVFTRFYRGVASRDQVRGTGLGLDIVRAAIEAHGGRVTVQSPPGRGATFIVRLPAAPEAADGG